LERGQLGSYWLELAIFTLVAFIALRVLRWMETPLNCAHDIEKLKIFYLPKQTEKRAIYNFN